MELAPTSKAIRPKSAPPRAQIRPYTPWASDFALKRALNDLRERKTIQHFGEYALQDLGAALFMGDKALQRIVDSSHYGKINNEEQLQRETRLSWAADDAKEILELIRRHPPQPPVTPLTTSAPLQPRNRLTNLKTEAPQSPVEDKVKRRNRCCACNQPGHNSEYFGGS
jgi:hypothetical protein